MAEVIFWGRTLEHTLCPAPFCFLSAMKWAVPICPRYSDELKSLRLLAKKIISSLETTFKILICPERKDITMIFLSFPEPENKESEL